MKKMPQYFPFIELTSEISNKETSFEFLINYFISITGVDFTDASKKQMINWLETHYAPGKSKSDFSKFYFARKLFLIFTSRKHQKNDRELPRKEDFSHEQQNPEKTRIESQFSALGSDEQFQI